jgi:hypothetical protein
MPAALEDRRFLAAQVLIGILLTLFLTYLSIAIADRPTAPQFVRCVISPGFVLGLRFANGNEFLDWLGSFGRIAVTVNVIYFGLINCLLFWKINWPKLPRNARHHFWMKR